MKNSILLILTLILFACGGGKKNSDTTSDNQLQELGTCSSTFTAELNAAEWGLKLYEDYGLKYGKELVQAHIDYGTKEERNAISSS